MQSVALAHTLRKFADAVRWQDCDGGKQTRHRQIDTQPAHGGERICSFGQFVE